MNSQSVKIQTITSPKNSVIKSLRSLREKKYLKQQKIFLVEGEEYISKALNSSWQPTAILSQQDIDANLLTSLPQNCQIIKTSARIISTITNKENPPSIIASFRQQSYSLESLESLFSSPSINKTNLLALDRIRNPGNLGTIIRSCEAFDIKHLILLDDCTHPFALEVIRAAAGSIFTIQIYLSTTENLKEWLKKSKTNLRIIGAHLNNAVDCREIDYRSKPNLFIMGNESKGLNPELVELCDILVKIPQNPSLESLNLAIATSIILYESKR